LTAFPTPEGVGWNQSGFHSQITFTSCTAPGTGTAKFGSGWAKFTGDAGVLFAGTTGGPLPASGVGGLGWAGGVGGCAGGFETCTAKHVGPWCAEVPSLAVTTSVTQYWPSWENTDAGGVYVDCGPSWVNV